LTNVSGAILPPTAVISAATFLPVLLRCYAVSLRFIAGEPSILMWPFPSAQVLAQSLLCSRPKYAGLFYSAIPTFTFFSASEEADLNCLASVRQLA